MILWGMIVGALIGWVADAYGADGILPGGVAGLGMGWWLRRILRREIARAQAPLLAEIDALRGSGRVDPREAEAVRLSDAAPPVSPWVASPEPPLAPDDGMPATADALTPSPPTVIDRLVAFAAGWLFGGNTIVRVGLVILFVGLSFLARYAANAGLFPIELRLAAVAAAGIALLAIGFTRRMAKPDFALTLQGGGVAILYLTLFAASRLFDLIPPGAAFPLMVMVCGLGCALALLQDSQVLAATSFAGGFAVPLLLGGGGGPLGLFLYYTVLNVAVPVLAYRRAWRIIGLTGFLVTFGVATAWGLLVYDPAQYALSQTFLILFVLIYAIAGILNASHRPGQRGNVVDGTLLFGPALAGFGLQAGLVADRPFGTAFSALGFGALYLTLAHAVVRRGRGDNRVLTDGLVAVAVGFVTLAVPLALGARWTASVWALEGAGAFWLGLRQARFGPRVFGLAMQAMALLAFVAALRPGEAAAPLANPATLGALLLALPALAIAWWLRTPAPTGQTRFATAYGAFERTLPKPIFLYGFALWCLAFAFEIYRLMPPRSAGMAPTYWLADDVRGLAMMLAYVGSAALSAWGGRRLGWAVALWPARATLVVLWLTFLARRGPDDFVLVTPHWLFWAIALVLHYRLLREDDRVDAPDTHPLRRIAHVGGAWLIAGLVTDSLWLGIDRGGLWGSSWAGVTLLAGAVVALLAILYWAGRTTPDARWPIASYKRDYLWVAAAPIALLVYLGAMAAALVAAGDTAPLPYVPLFNPVELTIALSIAALLLWRRAVLALDQPPPGAAALRGPGFPIALALLGFVTINMAWLRVAYHFLGVPWDASALLGDVMVETGLSILWTMLALALALMGHRRRMRGVWLAGAGLLGGVVAKLLLVDLSNADGAARIVTFIVVGVLMLVVGYFAPLPPKSDRAGAAA